MMLLIKIIGFMFLFPFACVALVFVSVIILSIATAIYDALRVNWADKKRLDEING